MTSIKLKRATAPAKIYSNNFSEQIKLYMADELPAIANVSKRVSSRLFLRKNRHLSLRIKSSIISYKKEKKIAKPKNLLAMLDVTEQIEPIAQIKPKT